MYFFRRTNLPMKHHSSVQEEMRWKIDECVAMAKASTSNKLRAYHFATAQVYLQLCEAEVWADRQAAPAGRDDD
jgi:hypothetical protein